MSNTDPNPLPHKERNVFPPEVVKEVFLILAEEDAKQEKQWQMKQQLSKQWRKSWKICKIAQNDCWSDDAIDSSGNDAQVQLNNMQIPYHLHCHSSM